MSTLINPEASIFTSHQPSDTAQALAELPLPILSLSRCFSICLSKGKWGNPTNTFGCYRPCEGTCLDAAPEANRASRACRLPCGHQRVWWLPFSLVPRIGRRRLGPDDGLHRHPLQSWAPWWCGWMARNCVERWRIARAGCTVDLKACCGGERVEGTESGRVGSRGSIRRVMGGLMICLLAKREAQGLDHARHTVLLIWS